MRARISIKMNGLTCEDRTVPVGRGIHIGTGPDSDFIVPHFDLRVVSHRDRLVVPGHAVLGPGQTWKIGIDHLSVEILYLRPAESRHFEPPVPQLGLFCATAAMVLMATFWDTAYQFAVEEPEVAVAAHAMSAQLGMSHWLELAAPMDGTEPLDASKDYPIVGYTQDPYLDAPVTRPK